MNIKSILLGSAAAFVAVSGARAADAVTLVEPEPAEYVRICDVYGTGFFYIPGTETCLQISGLVRARLIASGPTHSDLFADGDFLHTQNLDEDDRFDDYNFNTQIRGRLNFDAREETELGTLRAFIRVQATERGGSDAGFGTSNQNFVIDQGYIQLGGLTFGKLDSVWADKDGLYTDNDWSVGDISNNLISYTFANNGFSFTGSVEDDGDGDFVPDVVARAGYEGAFGSAFLYGIYDEDGFDPNNTDGFGDGGPYSFLDDYDVNDGDGAFALKANVELKDLIAAGSLFKIEGHYAFDPTEYASLEPGGYLGSAGFGTPSEYQIGAAYQQSFGKVTGIVSGVYGKLFDGDYDAISGFGTGLDEDGNADYFGGAVNVGYDITSNLNVQAEVSYRNVDSDKGGDHKDQTFGYIQLLRSF